MSLAAESLQPDVLPAAPVSRILILRTAQLPEVEWARGELARRYPGATVGILGSRLSALGAFDDCVRFEIDDPWITPASVRPLGRRLQAFAPDLVVLCLNNDSRAGYARVSRVMRSLPGSHKVVAAYTRRWFRWRHADFADGHPVLRRVVDAGVVLLCPLVFFYLLAKRRTPVYAATPTGTLRGARG
jgi:hypothetical protein